MIAVACQYLVPCLMSKQLEEPMALPLSLVIIRRLGRKRISNIDAITSLADNLGIPHTVRLRLASLSLSPAVR